MARLKFLCDASRCIDCDGCTVICKNANDVPRGTFRRRVVTIHEGEDGEASLSVACMHCSSPPCAAVCPVEAFYQTEDGLVLHSKEKCIGCGYCLFACPFGAPSFPTGAPFGARGVMDKCTYCAGGPEETFSDKERRLYGANRLAEGKLPACATACATRALLAGDAAEIADLYKRRAMERGSEARAWGWKRAYGKTL
ncbi:MAG: formate dehydrogenase FDH3 subunit beta [Deferrisomatales bacterium]